MADRPEWMNDPEVTLLNGEPIPEQMEFPVDPPAEIGPVLSAHSTCVHGKPLKSNSNQFLIMLGIFLLVSIPGTWVFGYEPNGSSLEEWIAAAIFGGFFGLLSLPLSWLYMRTQYWVDYVGTKGVARFKIRSWREVVKKRELFEFKSAVDFMKRLSTPGRSHCRDHSTDRPDYSFTWSDLKGKTVYTIAGNFKGWTWRLKPDNTFHLATAAELAWNEYRRDLSD